jgi:type VI secretion system protein ImpH
VRDAPDSVAARISERTQAWSAAPWTRDYFAAMRRLEALAAPAPRWGQALLPSAEAIRVGQEPSLSFATASISRFEPASAHAPPRLRQQFFGYLGPNGPLPLHLSEFVRERTLNFGDRTALAFLDVFSHRFALHFYRAWAKSKPAVALDRPAEDSFRRRVGALVGIGGAARQGRDAIRDDARLHFAGWLVRRVHNVEGVESVLRTYFGVPVRLERWVGHWMSLPAGELTRLGRGRPDELSCRLGQGALLGRRAWDRQHKIRLHLGPLSLAQYCEFLPSGTARPVMLRWMQQLLGEELEWDAELVLRKDEVPAIRLGTRRGNAPQLGWVSWLGGRERTRDAADVRIDARARGANLESIHE